MKPDRSNYEIWLIDWLDGNLDEARTEQLMVFLEQNPDLREEAESLSLSPLVPDKKGFAGISGLTKTAAELTFSQIEYLSTAYLENDLSPEQVKDLEEVISADPRNQRLFDEIQKTRLRPRDHRYEHKKLLLKTSPAQKAFSLVIRSLSTAAAVLVLITIFFNSDRTKRSEKVLIAAGASDTIDIRKGIPVTFKEQHPPETEAPQENKIITVPVAVNIIEETAMEDVMIAEETTIQELNPDMFISAVPIIVNTGFTSVYDVNSLIAANIQVPDPVREDPSRGRLQKFIAGTFRTKILRQDVYNDARLEPYEIAEAGIEGLNKLLGWEMALVRTSNESGDPQSVYFSSRILKINAPIKKYEPPM